jgi:plastocyanin
VGVSWRREIGAAIGMSGKDLRRRGVLRIDVPNPMEDLTVRFNAAGQAKTRSMPKASMLTLAVGLVFLAGCGSSSSSTSSSASTPASEPATSSSATTPSSAAGGQTLSVAANPEGQLKYDTTSLTAKAGKVSIDFTNMATLKHNLTIASSSGAVVGAAPTFQGGTKTLSLNLKPGTYKFYCTVPGHRAGGMEGTLTVQ